MKDWLDELKPGTRVRITVFPHFPLPIAGVVIDTERGKAVQITDQAVVQRCESEGLSDVCLFDDLFSIDPIDEGSES